MIRKIGFVRRPWRKREKPLTPVMVTIACAIYFPLALLIHAYDSGFLLFAWTMVAPLGVSIYLVRDRGRSLANPYTLFFATVVLLSLGGYAYWNVA